MKIFFIFFFICKFLEISAKCEICAKGPIEMKEKFSFMGKRAESIFIFPDRIEINDAEKYIKFNKLDTNQTKCDLETREIFQKEHLEWISEHVKKKQEFSKFEANWAFVITWMSFGENQCDTSKFFQIILTSNEEFSFAFFNFLKNYSQKTEVFQIGVKNENISNFIEMSQNDLVSKSNIGLNGKWIFLLDKKNKAATNSFSFLIVSLFFMFSLILKNE